MQYLLKTKGKKQKVAHLWNGSDTVCRMHSTGGLFDVNYKISETPEGRRLCQNCINVQHNNNYTSSKPLSAGEIYNLIRLRKCSQEYFMEWLGGEQKLWSNY